jgi:hypothetical protein
VQTIEGFVQKQQSSRKSHKTGLHRATVEDDIVASGAAEVLTRSGRRLRAARRVDLLRE